MRHCYGAGMGCVKAAADRLPPAARHNPNRNPNLNPELKKSFQFSVFS